MSGNAGCIVLLAQSGADVNVTDANGAYPLHYAANMSRDIEKLPEDAPVVSLQERELAKGAHITV